MNKFLVFSLVVFVLISCQSQGAVSVNGLLNNRDKYNDQQVTVKGFSVLTLFIVIEMTMITLEMTSFLF
jgi:uncharacterized protein YcfL